MADGTTPAIKTPWHFLVVGIVSLLWNSVGAMDFTLTQMKNEAYLKAFTPEQLAYFTGFPLWAVIFWGLGTWGGFLGSMVLLFRRSLAVCCFVTSLVGMVVTDIYCYVLSDGLKVMGGKAAGTAIFAAVIFVVGVLLLVYARAMRKSGVLR